MPNFQDYCCRAGNDKVPLALNILALPSIYLPSTYLTSVCGHVCLYLKTPCIYLYLSLSLSLSLYIHLHVYTYRYMYIFSDLEIHTSFPPFSSFPSLPLPSVLTSVPFHSSLPFPSSLPRGDVGYVVSLTDLRSSGQGNGGGGGGDSGGNYGGDGGDDGVDSSGNASGFVAIINPSHHQDLTNTSTNTNTTTF